MRGLAVALGELSKWWRDAQVVRPRLVVRERQPEELVAEHVLAVPVSHGEPRPPQASKRPVHGRLRTGGGSGHVLQRDAVRVARQLGGVSEHAIRPDKTGLVIQFHGSTVPIFHLIRQYSNNRKIRPDD